MLSAAFDQRLCPYTILTAIALVGFAPVVAEEESKAVCPPNLSVWRSQGNAEAGGRWEAGILEVHDEIGVLREVSIRFGHGVLPAEEARWFYVPSVLEPETLRTRV